MLDKNYGAIILLVIVSSLVFANTLGNSFVYDDISIVEENTSLSDLSNLKELFNNKRYFEISRERSYWPVITLSYFINYLLSKTGAWGYHLGNMFFHVIATVLVYLILKLTFKNRMTALAAGLFFAVHPAHTESVAWVCGRTDLVSGVFFFLAFLLYIKYAHSKPNLKKYYILSILFFVVALFSKEMAITLPLVLVLYDYCFTSGKDVLKIESIKRYSGYFLAALVFVVVRFSFFSEGPIARGYPPGGIFSILITFCKVILVYIRLLFVPVNLCADYNILVSTSLLDKGIIPSVIAVILIVAGGVMLAKRSKETAFTLFYFLVTLIPVSNIVPFGIIISERYLYIPSLGFCMLLAMLVTKFYKLYQGKGPSAMKLSVFFVAAILVLFSVMTLRRNTEWKSGITLWASVVRQFPGNPRAYNNLGNAYIREERYEEAAEQLQKTQLLRPNDAGSHYNLGVVYGKLGFYDKAEEEFKTANKIDPGYDMGSSVIGNLYFRKGDYGGAVKKYSDAITANPDDAEAYFNLASAYKRMGKYDEAEANYRIALEKNPGFFESWNNIGTIYREKGMIQQAVKMFKKAIEINPLYFDSHYNLGMIYSGSDWNAMIKELEIAADIKPGHEELNYNLGIAYNRTGQAGKAIKAYEKEIEVNPAYASSYKNAGLLYYGRGKHVKAVSNWKKYLELRPDAPDRELIRKEINKLEK